MVDLQLLAKRGITPEALRKIFTDPDNRGPTFERPSEPVSGPVPATTKKKKESKVFSGVNALRNRLRLRIQNGRDHNLNNWQTYHAVDLAMDVPLQKAITPTMIRQLVDKAGSESEAKELLKGWGFNLDEVVTEVTDAKVDGKNVKKVSAPAFFQIIPPLVLAYKTIRQAKIMNDLLVSPFFEYEPAYESTRSRMQCDVLTSRVEVMSQGFGYYNVVDQAVSNMLSYGRAFQFPQEEWYTEEQEVENPEDAAQEDGQPLMNKEGRYYRIDKEGIRYHVPHPSRVFFDKNHAPVTFNTDTGCEYAGYWRVMRYKDLVDNPAYYNADRISIGNYQWTDNWSSFFNTVYPCTMAFPSTSPVSNDRETQLIDYVYTQDMADKAVVVTEYFEKLIPKDYGLGDYQYPVWFRFVVASDDTIIYAAPMAYAPTIVYPAGHDQNKAQTSSMALEVLPWQDHMGNLLTQYLLTIKQNLANVTFVDQDMVDPKDLGALRNLGEKLFRLRNFIPFSGRLFKTRQQAPPTAFYSHSFPQLDANGIVQAMRMMLDMLERVLQMSSQELGQAASHEQSKGEVDIISQQTSTRLTNTVTPVHQAMAAMMRQIYEGTMAHGSESFWAQIPYDRNLTPELIESLGFSYHEEEHPVRHNGRKMTVRASKKSLALLSFVSLRTNGERMRNPQLGMAMFQSIDRLMAGPAGPAIGTHQALEMIDLAGRVAGWPKDFKLKDMSPKLTPEQQGEQIRQQLSGYIEEIRNGILGEVKAGLQPILERQKQDEEAIAHISQIIQSAEAHRPPPMLAAPPPVANGQVVTA